MVLRPQATMAPVVPLTPDPLEPMYHQRRTLPNLCLLGGLRTLARHDEDIVTLPATDNG